MLSIATALTIGMLTAPGAIAADASTLQTLINQDRASNGGLPPLTWSACLQAVAMQNAQRIADQGFLSHTTGPDLDLACGAGATSAGENVAYISSGINDAQVNTMYMNSPGHRANILGSYNYTATAWVVTPNGYGYNAEEFLNAPRLPIAAPASQQSFYFAEGYTGSGFNETLSLLMPNASGTATIDYYTKAGHLPTVSVALTAGHVLIENVNTDVGANQEVSARVSFPAPGVAERTIHFNNGSWHGSTDKVGATATATEWDFAEGSTLSAYSEYLTLQNPGSASAPVTLNYFTDGGAHPVKHLTLAPNSRTTIEVVSGDLSTPGVNCTPGAGGTCGVGAGIGGVSVQVLSGTPIIAERPFYVNGFDFGFGAIRDGHVAFGANGPATQWNFAEGTTISGFNEYLTLENPNTAPAPTTLRYLDNNRMVTVKTLTINPQSRVTVAVFGSALGVGQGIGGVSVQVTAGLPIVAERPMYIVHDFGTGAVAGASVAVGATTLGYIYGFAAASTASGENDFLTILNPGVTQADVLVSYYTASGVRGQLIPVGPNSRQTVLVFSASGGVGPGVGSLGIVVWSDQPVLVEKPTYSSNPGTYGATVAPGLNAASF